MSGFTAVGYFLFSLMFSLITFVLWARIAIRYYRISFLHPIAQSINTFTDPIIRPLAHLFKSSNTRANRYDWVCFSVLIVFEGLKFITLAWLVFGTLPSLAVIFLWTIADLIIQPCQLLFYAILIRVIMSWVNPHWKNNLSDILYIVTEPLLRVAHRTIPTIGGLDFAPFAVLIALKVITLFIGTSIPNALS